MKEKIQNILDNKLDTTKSSLLLLLKYYNENTEEDVKLCMCGKSERVKFKQKFTIWWNDRGSDK